jgi:hypothetical protein
VSCAGSCQTANALIELGLDLTAAADIQKHTHG